MEQNNTTTKHMEKTAMNQMLEELIAHEWEIPMTLIVKAKELVQVEKEQISQGYMSGLIDGMNQQPKEYYNETYGKE